MKKLYKKGTVHPTPPLVTDQLAFLPAAIFTLTLALSPADREVLAYLLSSSSSTSSNYSNINNFNTKKSKNTTSTSSSSSRVCYSNGVDHATSFNCSCFRCYMSFWVRWDSSPNRQLIHEIIDAFEDGLTQQGRKEKEKKGRRRKGSRKNGDKEVVVSGDMSPVKSESSLVESVSVESCSVDGGDQSSGVEEEEEAEELEKGSIRRFVSFVGEKIWGVWN